MPISTAPLRPYPDCPLVVAYGLGVDSTSMLIEFVKRGIKPDLILFADTGAEKPETVGYLNVIRPYLLKAGFPDVTVVAYRPKTAKYHTLEGQCLHTGTQFVQGILDDGGFITHSKANACTPAHSPPWRMVASRVP